MEKDKEKQDQTKVKLSLWQRVVKFFGKINFALTICLIVATVLCYSAAYVNPDKFPLSGLAGMAYPFVLVIDVLYMLLLAFLKKYSAFIMLAVIGAGYKFIDRTVQLNPLHYVDDFDISGDLPVTYLTSMAGSTNETFGTVSFVCNSYGVSRRVKYINLIGSKVRNRLTRLITIGFSKLISSSITLACQSTKSNPTNSNRIHPILLPCQRSIRRLKRLNIWYRVPIPFQILCLTQLA